MESPRGAICTVHSQASLSSKQQKKQHAAFFIGFTPDWSLRSTIVKTFKLPAKLSLIKRLLLLNNKKGQWGLPLKNPSPKQ
jgi:hypothetical protein